MIKPDVCFGQNANIGCSKRQVTDPPLCPASELWSDCPFKCDLWRQGPPGGGQRVGATDKAYHRQQWHPQYENKNGTLAFTHFSGDEKKSLTPTPRDV